MATKKSNLQNALQQQAKGKVIDAPITQTESSKVYKQPKHPEKTIQDLLGEALNDLFAKYNVPQTAQLDE
jgi:hypothetical protein